MIYPTIFLSCTNHAPLDLQTEGSLLRVLPYRIRCHFDLHRGSAREMSHRSIGLFRPRMQ